MRGVAAAARSAIAAANLRDENATRLFFSFSRCDRAQP